MNRVTACNQLDLLLIKHGIRRIGRNALGITKVCTIKAHNAAPVS
jgi:hypothetical protein